MRRVLLIMLLSGACKRESPQVITSALEGTPPAACVPRVLVAHQGTPTLDGELDEPVWHAAAASTPFVNDKLKRVVPHTEARAAWDADSLYLALYTADADLRSDDQVAVNFADGGVITVTPQGTVSCDFAGQRDCTGVVAKLERDGDVDADAEEDEEWVVELSVPWKVLAPGGRPSQLPLNFSRLETLEGERLREVWSRGCGALALE